MSGSVLNFFKEMEIMEQWPGFKKVEDMYCFNNKHYFKYITERNTMRSVQPVHRRQSIYFPLKRNDAFVIKLPEKEAFMLYAEFDKYFYLFKLVDTGYFFEQEPSTEEYRLVIWPF
jgi:hypothetical protein